MMKYDFIASYYDVLLSFLEKKRLRPFRKRFVPEIEGRTLDIAVGTGNNIEFYPDKADVVLIDKSVKMLEKSKRKAQFLNESKSLQFVQSAVESLPFQDESFDTLLSIDVFCSVKNPEQSLDELHRVLKKGGKAIFVEHMRTGKGFTDLFLGILTVFTWILVSSSMIRPIDRYIKDSKFKILRNEELSGSFRVFHCTK